jgi:rhodanese-related sulfurtransferase
MDPQLQIETIFSTCRLQIDGISFVLSGEVPELLRKETLIVDLREELETNISAFGIENVIYLPYSEFEKSWESLPFEVPLLFADSVGLHSKEAVIFLKTKGYVNVASLAGGFAGWLQDGQPVKAGKYHPLNGPCPCMIKPHERK